MRAGQPWLVLLAAIAAPLDAVGNGAAPRAPTLSAQCSSQGGPSAVVGRVPADCALSFVATLGAEARGRWLYLLEKSTEVRVISPAPHQVLLGGDGALTIEPHSFSGAPPGQWRSSHHGEVEYVLVAAPTPRDVVGSRPLPDVDTFLAPPPSLSGPSATPAIVVARLSLWWP